MNKRIAIGIAVMAMAVTAVHAATGDSLVTGGLWSAPATWSGGIVPGTNALTVEIAAMTGASTVTLNSSVPQPLNRVQVGQGGTGAGAVGSTGTLIINAGGSFTVTNAINVGMNRFGSFTMNGGNVTNGGNFNIANSATAGGQQLP